MSGILILIKFFHRTKNMSGQLMAVRSLKLMGGGGGQYEVQKVVYDEYIWEPEGAPPR